MSDAAEITAAPELTPCGRVPGAPLKNRKHERVAHGLACGKTSYDACRWIDDDGRLTGAIDPNGSSYAPNARRLCQRAEIRERVVEIARMESDAVGVYAGWILADLILFARASAAKFWRRTPEGKLELQNGRPVVDLSHASEEDLRTIAELKVDKFGASVKVYDPTQSLEKLGRHLGLWRDKLALTDPSGEKSWNPLAELLNEIDGRTRGLPSPESPPG